MARDADDREHPWHVPMWAPEKLNRKKKRKSREMQIYGRELTQEELAYAEASKLASQRSRFVSHAIVWAATVAFLLFTAGFTAAMIVALSWGIGLALHGYNSVLAPQLRRKWTEDAVQQRLHVQVSHERRSLEGKHSRSLQKLSASIAHEIRNPITAAKSLVQQIGEDPTAPENSEYAQVAVEELDRVEKSISHLLRYARDEEIKLTNVDMADVVDSALETFRDRLATGVDVQLDLDGDSTIRGDAEKLRRVVINLVANALDAMEQVGTPDAALKISSGHNLAGTELWVRIADNGPGIEPERLSKIFSPFHTSKAHGTGLGLAITKKSIEAHGGSIEVQSEVALGTEFVLTFPKSDSQPRLRDGYDV